MTKKLKPIPIFAAKPRSVSSGKATIERTYVDWSKAQRARFPNLKLSPVSAPAKPRKGVGHDSD